LQRQINRLLLCRQRLLAADLAGRHASLKLLLGDSSSFRLDYPLLIKASARLELLVVQG